jgi:hypothetical protein
MQSLTYRDLILSHHGKPSVTLEVKMIILKKQIFDIIEKKTIGLVK